MERREIRAELKKEAEAIQAENLKRIFKKPESLTEILKRYVEYKLKQAELVNLSHSSRRESLEESRDYSVLATENNNAMEKFAESYAKRYEYFSASAKS